eukprot:gene5965-8219_t
MIKNLPSYTEIHTSSPIAAGVPVLEVVRKLEEEKILTRLDRIALKDALYDPLRRDRVVKALCDIELSMYSNFTVRKLKVLLYQNNSGEVSNYYLLNQNNKLHKDDQDDNLDELLAGNINLDENNKNNNIQKLMTTSQSSPISLNQNHRFGEQSKNTSPNRIPKNNPNNKLSEKNLLSHNNSNVNSNMNSHNSSHTNSYANIHQVNIQQQHNQPPRSLVKHELDEDLREMDIQSTIHQVVGDTPIYSGPDNFKNICAKITSRLHDIQVKSKNNLEKYKFVVLVGSGSFNPLTRMHIRTFFLAKQYLESKLGFTVLGSLLSPAHSATVRERYRTNPSEIIPSPHRLAVAQLLVQNSKWLSIDPWEITRRRAMDYLSLLEHTNSMLVESYPTIEIKVIYLCKPNMVPKLSPSALRNQSFGCACVCRAPESDLLRNNLGARWNGIIHVIEDSAILDASLDNVTSRKVRDKVKGGESVEQLVGAKINDYFNLNRIGPKMNGVEKWSHEEKLLPKIASRPAPPTLRSQSVNTGVTHLLSLTKAKALLEQVENNGEIFEKFNNSFNSNNNNNNNNNFKSKNNNDDASSQNSNNGYKPSWEKNNSMINHTNNTNHISNNQYNYDIINEMEMEEKI